MSEIPDEKGPVFVQPRTDTTGGSNPTHRRNDGPPPPGGVVQVGERPLPRTSLLKHTILTKPIQQPGWLGMNLVLD